MRNNDDNRKMHETGSKGPYGCTCRAHSDNIRCQQERGMPRVRVHAKIKQRMCRNMDAYILHIFDHIRRFHFRCPPFSHGDKAMVIQYLRRIEMEERDVTGRDGKERGYGTVK